MTVKHSLFHSFPRHSIDSAAEELAHGLNTLSLMLDVGLLLNHERIPFPMISPAGIDHEGGSIVDQLRCCFTLIDRNDLLQHSGLFGAFAFEFDLGKLRALGAFPVTYIPNAVRDEFGALSEQSALGNNIVHQMRDVAVLLEELLELQQAVVSLPAGVRRFQISSDERGAFVDRVSVDAVLSYLLGRKVSFEYLLDAVTVLTNMFYFSGPISNGYSGDPGRAEYYHEKEWRVVSGLVANGFDNDRELTDLESKRLLRHSDFFTSEVELKGNRISSQAYISRALAVPGGRSIYDLCTSLHVPDCVFTEVCDMLGSRSLDPARVTRQDYRAIVEHRAGV